MIDCRWSGDRGAAAVDRLLEALNKAIDERETARATAAHLMEETFTARQEIAAWKKNYTAAEERLAEVRAIIGSVEAGRYPCSMPHCEAVEDIAEAVEEGG